MDNNDTENNFDKKLAVASFVTGTEAFQKKDYFVAYMNFKIAYENDPSITAGLMTLRSMLIPEIEKENTDSDEIIDDLIDDLTFEYPESVDLFLLAIHYYVHKKDEFNISKYLMQVVDNIKTLNLKLTTEQDNLLTSFVATFIGR